jgi:hypothetical protein
MDLKLKFDFFFVIKEQKKTGANSCLVYRYKSYDYFLDSQTNLFRIAHCFRASRASTAG